MLFRFTAAASGAPYAVTQTSLGTDIHNPEFDVLGRAGKRDGKRIAKQKYVFTEDPFYEWLPWVDGKFDDVPKDKAARKTWLANQRTRPHPPAVAAALDARYGACASSRIKHVETFELCEYGRQPSLDELRAIFPK